MTTGCTPLTRAAAVMTLALAGCGSSGPPASGTLHVLFIGNSLTYTNSLPETIAELSLSTGGAVRIEVRDVSNPGYALEDHWNDARTMDALDAGGWDVVVLQQGPSSLPESQTNLRYWAAQFADRIRKHGARPALFMVWPENTRLSAFDAVRESYRAAADTADADLYPAGEAWRAAWREDSTLAFYGPDGFHPSALGSYLAALTIFHGLTRRTVIGLPAPFAIDPDVADILQRAAEEATATFGRQVD
jgi:hypothetical protein